MNAERNASERILRAGPDRILYDPTRLTEAPDPDWFEPEYWRRGGALAGAARGRGAVQFITRGNRQWALRHCRRGGLVGRLIADRYLYTGQARVRSFAEWRLLQRLTALGLPVPAPVAARYRRRGPWYRADLITIRLEHDATLAESLRAPALPADQQWRLIGCTIRRFHDAGLDHADLNAHNILLSGPTVYLVDFDRGALRPPGRWRSANLKRLLRSLRKLAPPEHGARLDAAWDVLVTAYQGG